MVLHELELIPSIWLEFSVCLREDWDSPGDTVIKNCQPVHEMQVQSLAREDPLEEEMATHSSTFACKIS